MQGLLLDTCALIWVMTESRLAPSAWSRIKMAGESGVIWVSPISAFEIATLVRKGRLILAKDPVDWFEEAMSTPGVSLSPMSPRLLINSSFLPGSPPNDPADRIIIATARAQSLTVVTRDEKIISYGAAGNVLTLAC